MAHEMEKLVGTSEEEDDEEEEGMELDVKEEEDQDEDGRIHAMVADDVDMGTGGRYFLLPPDLPPEAGDRSDTPTPSSASGSRRSRPAEEKERTKLRERHRRAITGRILSGLRRHGNYNLRVRADINEVIAALAREAGWIVLPDGTTFPSSQAARPVSAVASASATPTTPTSTQPPLSPSLPFRGISPVGALRTLDHPSGRLKGVFTPPISTVDGHCGITVAVPVGANRAREKLTDSYPLIDDSTNSGNDKQSIDVKTRMPERDFSGTSYIPVYVMLPLGVINKYCEVVDPDCLVQQLKNLKSIGIDGVMVDCWWGIVEPHVPQQYNWKGYIRLFEIVRDLKLKLKVVMSFHECGGNIGDNLCIPLPQWVEEIGRCNPNIYFTDSEGRCIPECLSCGVNKERVLLARTALEVYFDFMRSFRVEFDHFFEDGTICEIQIGLGPSGELRYPSFPLRHGWRYPGIGEFQCYDLFLQKHLKKTADARGHSVWARGPNDVGSYNSQPHETGFFSDGGEYNSPYGRFFLGWYSQVLVEHCDNVLFLAKLVFDNSPIAVKIPGIHWWYKTASHAAELTAGFYNPCNRDGYAPIASMLKKHGAALNFTCSELCISEQFEDFPEAMADPEGLAWQVLNAAWDAGIPVSSENVLPCYDRDSYTKILDNAKPLNDPDRRHLSSFTYLRLCSTLLQNHNFLEFERFVKQMHGECVPMCR
ncbi:beta-amylase 2, chloroplastic-like isoform X1 [Zingiber officinale]|uniref:beta-amylase 2, chloroplastic-like isoform X1 n=2 Tax=Zingiber officinale TaxID=94328 RepID=UPI001C4DB426|nr:beta-amylase 2, chloroplastic-like isoform X1 [Zingiber officinale]